MADLEMLRVRARGWVFDARAAGPVGGDGVLLLHGWPQTGREWRRVLPELAGWGHRAVSPDQRGYSPGARPSEVEAYAAPELVADVIGIADALGFDRFHLVGHDWGGTVAWLVAGRHPERVRSLTVLSTPHPAAFRAAIRSADQQGRSSYMAYFRRPDSTDGLLADGGARFRRSLAGSGMPPGDVDWHVAHFADRDLLDASLHWYRAARGADLDVGPISVPTTYLWGSDDPALGRGAAEATGAHVVGPYRFVELPGVGHWVAEVAADRVVAELRDRLDAGS